jgi:hypothetical protein
MSECHLIHLKYIFECSSVHWIIIFQNQNIESKKFLLVVVAFTSVSFNSFLCWVKIPLLTSFKTLLVVIIIQVFEYCLLRYIKSINKVNRDTIIQIICELKKYLIVII